MKIHLIDYESPTLSEQKIVSKVSTFIFKKDIEFLTNSKILPLFYYKTVLTTYHLRNTYIDNQTQKKIAVRLTPPIDMASALFTLGLHNTCVT